MAPCETSIFVSLTDESSESIGVCVAYDILARFIIDSHSLGPPTGHYSLTKRLMDSKSVPFSRILASTTFLLIFLRRDLRRHYQATVTRISETSTRPNFPTPLRMLRVQNSNGILTVRLPTPAPLRNLQCSRR